MVVNMLQEIPLNNTLPNQRVSAYVNNQNITLDLYTVISNDNKEYIFCNLYLSSNLIAAGVKCVHGSYINQYLTPLNGYLFFYCDDQLNPTYTKLGNISHLLYSDFDALKIDYDNFVKNNLAELQSRIGT